MPWELEKEAGPTARHKLPFQGAAFILWFRKPVQQEPVQFEGEKKHLRSACMDALGSFQPPQPLSRFFTRDSQERVKR